MVDVVTTTDLQREREMEALRREVEAAKKEAAEHFLRAREWAERCGAAQAEVEALRAELAKCGPRWADGGDAMAGALAGM